MNISTHISLMMVRPKVAGSASIFSTPIAEITPISLATNHTPHTTPQIKMAPYHHPLRPISWRRRTATANPAIPRYKLNMSTPKETSSDITTLSSGISSTTIEMIIPRMKENNVHHQNSERRARPLNTNDFFRQVLTASTKPIRGLSIRFPYLNSTIFAVAQQVIFT